MVSREERQWALIESLREELRLARRAARPLTPPLPAREPLRERQDQVSQTDTPFAEAQRDGVHHGEDPSHDGKNDQASRGGERGGRPARGRAGEKQARDQASQCEVQPGRWRVSSPGVMEALERAFAGRGRRLMLSATLLVWRLVAVKEGARQHILSWLERRGRRSIVKAALRLWRQLQRRRRRNSQLLSSATRAAVLRRRVMALRRWLAGTQLQRRRRVAEERVHTRCMTLQIRAILRVWDSVARYRLYMPGLVCVNPNGGVRAAILHPSATNWAYYACFV